MFVKRIYPPLQTVLWTKRYILLFVVLSVVPVLLQEFANVRIFVPWLPMALIGTAVAFYIGFKNNTSYERQWEARKLYGALVNTSRTWALHVNGYLTAQFAAGHVDEQALQAAKTRLVHRHLAWLHALRFQLRTHRPWEMNNAENTEYRKRLYIDEYETEKFAALAPYLSPQELEGLRDKANTATAILQDQMQDLVHLRAANWIDDFRHMELGNRLRELYDHQGGLERI